MKTLSQRHLLVLPFCFVCISNPGTKRHSRAWSCMSLSTSQTSTGCLCHSRRQHPSLCTNPRQCLMRRRTIRVLFSSSNNDKNKNKNKIKNKRGKEEDKTFTKADGSHAAPPLLFSSSYLFLFSFFHSFFSFFGLLCFIISYLKAPWSCSSGNHCLRIGRICPTDIVCHLRLPTTRGKKSHEQYSLLAERVDTTAPQHIPGQELPAESLARQYEEE